MMLLRPFDYKEGTKAYADVLWGEHFVTEDELTLYRKTKTSHQIVATRSDKSEEELNDLHPWEEVAIINPIMWWSKVFKEEGYSYLGGVE